MKEAPWGARPWWPHGPKAYPHTSAYNTPIHEKKLEKLRQEKGGWVDLTLPDQNANHGRCTCSQPALIGFSTSQRLFPGISWFK